VLNLILLFAAVLLLQSSFAIRRRTATLFSSNLIYFALSHFLISFCSFFRFLQSKNIGATVLHSGKSQEQREANLANFRAGRHDVLVATNVAGRGIDIPGVTLVINFDAPPNIEDYTHRIGRTGRAGTSGVAVTYIGEADSAIFYDLKRFLDSSPKAIIPGELRSHAATRIKPGGLMDKHGKTVKGVE
jgi:ATP-dependent RNA helicase DDX23/PRP28